MQRSVDHAEQLLQSAHPITTRVTRHHTAAVLRHVELGNVLVVDNEVQHVQAWAPLYHEPLIHVPAMFVKSIGSVLILGGGSLFAAQEALRYKSVKRVIMVEHDRAVIDLVSGHYDHAAAVLRDSRLSIIDEDASDYVERCQDRFDLIVNDSIDLKKLGQGRDMFRRLAALLTPAGVCADVVYRHLLEQSDSLSTLEALTSTHACAFSLVFIPEYPGVLHLLACWGNSPNISQSLPRTANTEHRRWSRSAGRGGVVYFDPRFTRFYLHLPPYVRLALGGGSACCAKLCESSSQPKKSSRKLVAPLGHVRSSQ